MCSNYRPVTRMDRMLSFFGVTMQDTQDFPPEAWPTGLAPFIKRAEEGSGNRVVEGGHFGLLPRFAKELAYGRRTYNARSETVHQLASFKDAWARGQRCIVPAEAIFEPCYESGKAVRWAIQQPGEVPMGIGGIYRRWRHPADGRWVWSFAMLTVSGAGHPVFQRMHKPEDEKRMVLIIDPAEYDRWLQCSVEEAATLLRQWHGTLVAFAAPLPPRGKSAPPPLPTPSAGGTA